MKMNMQPCGKRHRPSQPCAECDAVPLSELSGLDRRKRLARQKAKKP